MAISATGPRRFAVIGEPVVAVDLINTVAAPGSPAADDLLATDRDVHAWELPKNNPSVHVASSLVRQLGACGLFRCDY